MDTIADYKRVRFEEYASVVAFALGSVIFGYWAIEGMRTDQNTFSTLVSFYVAMGCGSLAESSLEEGKKMSREVKSRLEKKLENKIQL